MRYAILGDIHSNLAALRAVAAALEAETIDGYLCLGDVVGYGADPKACIDIVRDLGSILIGGNHDWGTAGRISLAYFNGPARAAIEWTQGVLSPADRVWLGGLSLMRRVGDITLAHATLHEPQVFEYIFTPYDAYLSFRHLTTSVAFVGHSHVPVTFYDGNPIRYSTDVRFRLIDRRAIANVGSVGQPRDENPDAAYGVFDTETRVLMLHRAEYDVEQSMARIVDAGLPPILAERLRIGR
ncbi:MAG: metallophosphoesterase [Planctomycetota bacterium]